MVVGEDLIVELRAGGYGRDGSVCVFMAIPEFQRAHYVVVAIRHICNFSEPSVNAHRKEICSTEVAAEPSRTIQSRSHLKGGSQARMGSSRYRWNIERLTWD